MSDRPTRQRHTILVVDDERSTVNSVRHLLRREYKVLRATSGAEALQLLAEQPVSVILCDQRMPGLTGDKVLEAVRRDYPNTVRILITAYADLQALIRTVNRGQIFAYVAKPWSPEELERIVEDAVAWRQLIDDNGRMTAELAGANEALQRTVEELRQFTHVVAHDLKEPLRTITAYAQFLRDDLEPTGDAREYVDGIVRCSQNLRSFIDDLLRIAELDHVAPMKRPVPLADCVHEALALLEAATREGGAVVTVTGDLTMVNGDPQRLVMLFQNLLSNAIKFNESASPRVEVAAEPAPPGMVGVRIADNGIGMPTGQLDDIFRVFHRLHTRGDFPGTGAGLAIVRKIVDGHGGTISVESVEGEGSIFHVAVPAA